MEHEVIWDKTLEFIKNSVSSVDYNTVYKPLRPVEIDGAYLVLECKDSMHLSFSEHERDTVESALKNASPSRLMVRFVLPQAKKQTVFKAAKEEMSSGNLNPSLNFDNFVVGTGNNFAYNVCCSVAKLPESDNKSKNMFNPLFLYGGSGLGKTHLIQAIGNEIIDMHPEKRVVYTQCETFLNEFISSLSGKSFEPFRKKYRNCDFLLIDDIQFLENKEGTQEEFFHTFNALYERGSQIVLTCDKPPTQLNSLEKRLITRFSSGVLVDIQAPDYETRVAILKNMANSNYVEFPDDVLDYIASNISSNVRELEGAFKKVLAYTQLQGEVTLSMTQQVLHDMIHPQATKKVNAETIIAVICAYYNITVDDIMSPRRDKNIAYPRMMAMYFFRTILDMTLGKISEYFGKKDHTTARSACKKIDIIVKEKEVPFCDEIEELRKRISL